MTLYSVQRYALHWTDNNTESVTMRANYNDDKPITVRRAAPRWVQGPSFSVWRADTVQPTAASPMLALSTQPISVNTHLMQISTLTFVHNENKLAYTDRTVVDFSVLVFAVNTAYDKN